MKRLINSFAFACRGIWLASLEQPNLRIHLVAAIAVVSLAFSVGVTKVEWCILLLCIGSVLSMELVNSSIEGLVDLVSPERQPKAGKIKDIAAAAVLVSAVVSGTIAVIIFSRYLF